MRVRMAMGGLGFGIWGAARAGARGRGAAPHIELASVTPLTGCRAVQAHATSCDSVSHVVRDLW